MTELDTGTNRILFSYEIPVAACIGGTYYRTQEHFNNTTSRHISEWLNDIQAEWMALASDDPKADAQRVYKRMEQYPRAYLSITPDFREAGAIVDSMPCWAHRRPLAEALQWLRDLDHTNKRTDVAWCGKLGRWVAIPTPQPDNENLQELMREHPAFKP